MFARDRARMTGKLADRLAARLGGLATRLCCIPGHALHEKSLHKQMGVGTLVRIQERRALLVPRIYHR